MASLEFAEWMMIEAKASREGLPVDPLVEGVALAVDDWVRNSCAELMRYANEHRSEIERWAE